MGPDEAERHVRVIADSTKALRAARQAGERLLLSEHDRALLSGAVLVLAWVSVEEMQ